MLSVRRWGIFQLPAGGSQVPLIDPERCSVSTCTEQPLPAACSALAFSRAALMHARVSLGPRLAPFPNPVKGGLPAKAPEPRVANPG